MDVVLKGAVDEHHRRSKGHPLARRMDEQRRRIGNWHLAILSYYLLDLETGKREAVKTV